ncbi:MAG: DUF5642 family protein [Mycobacterium sp.]
MRIRHRDVRRHLAAEPLTARLPLALLSAAAILVGCGAGPQQPPAPAPTARTLSPANVVRVRAALPPGYETGELKAPVSAAALWGFGTGWRADPPQCAALADPAPNDRAARGLSASGPGGTVFVVVADMPGTDPVPELLDQCPSWTMTFGHTTAEVTRSQGPAVADARTFAWRAVASTVVESGNSTTSEASTAVACLQGHVVLVTVVTDPGSPNPPLDPGFAADLLATTVTALRG